MAKPVGRALKLRDCDEHIVRDHDPDADVASSEQGSNSDTSDDGKAATEHYVAVGKSRLRSYEGVGLGPEYSGSCVRRSALEGDSESESQDGSQDGESQDEDEENDVENDDAQDEDEDEDEDEEEDADDDENGEEVDDDEDDDQGHDSSTDNKRIPRPIKRDSSPQQTAPSGQTDAEKGIAIQKQRRMYDGLLNLRIRLQKALVAANTFPTVTVGQEAETSSKPYDSAEEAAVKLLQTLSSIREKLGASHGAGIKRKRQADDVSDEALWMRIQEQEHAAADFRRERLDKWHRKVQSVNGAMAGAGQNHRTLVQVLDSQLQNGSERLVKRTRVPRSCAPCQAALKVAEDDGVFDDADFYQVLLKELVDERTVESAEAVAGSVPTVMLTAAREAKTRKQVDRKASKGRKLRFTVHEKLQDFMAPEDRRSWEQQGIERFLGTLLGRKMELNEDDDDEEVERDEWTGLNGGDEAQQEIRLFGN